MFDSPEELTRKIRLGEDSSLELKQSVRATASERRDLADELAAMANGSGGVLVVGVDDSGQVLGLAPGELRKVETQVHELCSDTIEPPLTAKILLLEIPNAVGDSKAVVKVDVPKSLFVHKSPGGYFHRIGSSKREMRPEVLARLFQQRSQTRLIRFEEQPVPETGLGDLEPELWGRFLGAEAVEEPRNTLHKMKLLTRDEEGQERATVAGVLFCCSRPDRFIPGALVEAVRYRGRERDSSQQTDAQQIRGPLDRQIRDAFAFARRNMVVAARKEIGRQDFPQFSERAMFEALVNAVAHRDYSIHGSKIRLFMFEDRLELSSPGALPNSITVESLALRQSTRNELVTSLLARCPVDRDEEPSLRRRYFMEKRGEGVPIILRESRELSGREPTYRVVDDAELLLTILSAELPNQLGS